MKEAKVAYRMLLPIVVMVIAGQFIPDEMKKDGKVMLCFFMMSIWLGYVIEPFIFTDKLK